MVVDGSRNCGFDGDDEIVADVVCIILNSSIVGYGLRCELSCWKYIRSDLVVDLTIDDSIFYWCF